MAIMLSLFSDAEMSGLSSLRSDAPAAPAASIVDPCKACALKGLCGDDCGMHLFELDAPYPPVTKFPNLNSFIKFKKHYGWL